MGIIYKIVNKINQKIYVGKTEFSIEKRWQEHCKDAFKRDYEQRPLYTAIRKYGIENFSIEIIDKADTADELCRKEIYWIGQLDSYHNGYNATLGGDGKSWYDHQAIIEALRQTPYPILVAQQFQCSSDLVCELAHLNNIPILNLGHKNVATAKAIEQWSKDNSQYIQTFDTVAAAAKWCTINKLTTSNGSQARSHISECANGKRKTAYQYSWRYVQG